MILRETQNQNDADDASDAESGIWYRDILKTASQASSASLSSHKSSAGVWGTPQKCVCGYPNAMLAKHVYPQNDDKQTRYPHKFVYAHKSESLLVHPKILTRKSESVLIHFLRWSAKNYNCITKITIRRFHGTLYWIQNSFARGRKTVCVQN